MIGIGYTVRDHIVPYSNICERCMQPAELLFSLQSHFAIGYYCRRCDKFSPGNMKETVIYKEGNEE